MLFAQVIGKLGGGCRFARTLQANQHNHVRRLTSQVKLILALAAAQHLNQLFIDDLKHLLRRRETAQHFRANSLRLHPLDELTHQLQADIRLQQRQPDFAHRLIDICLGQLALPTQIGKNTLKSLR